MHPVLAELRTAQRISHVFVAELPSYPKLLYITDAAINIAPNLSIKAEIVQNAINLVRLLGIEQPKVAALSAVEVVKPDIISTVDAACLSKMAERGQIKHAIIDGPLAFDNAISAQAAEIKHIKSPVAGDVRYSAGTGSQCRQYPGKRFRISGRCHAGRGRHWCKSAHPAAITFRPAAGTTGCRSPYRTHALWKKPGVKNNAAIVTFNAGSSSLKFGLYVDNSEGLSCITQGGILDLDSQPVFEISHKNKNQKQSPQNLPQVTSHAQAINWLFNWLQQNFPDMHIVAAGHRVVHGGNDFTQAVKIDRQVLQQLHQLTHLAPLHMPHNLAVIEALQKHRPHCHRSPVLIPPFITL